MYGLGDNVFSRPFVHAATKRWEVWLDTPWPEIYEDLNIKFVRGQPRRLRTQNKNINRQPRERWSLPPSGTARQIKIGYGADLQAWSIIHSMETQWANVGIGFDPSLFNLPDMGAAPFVSNRPIAVVRPVTVRSEWRNEARNPLPEYLTIIIRHLMVTHTVVMVADLEPGQEWLVGKLPPAHQYFVNGELSVRQLLALVRDADVVVGPVGWIVPVGLALKVKTFVVLGGHGGHNAPHKITDKRLDLSRLGFATPDRFCQCTGMLHNCKKEMADPLGQFCRWWANFQVAV
jgi:hypothetical protein